MTYALIASILVNGLVHEYVIDYNLTYEDCVYMAQDSVDWPIFANGVEFTCEQEPEQ